MFLVITFTASLETAECPIRKSSSISWVCYKNLLNLFCSLDWCVILWIHMYEYFQTAWFGMDIKILWLSVVQKTNKMNWEYLWWRLRQNLCMSFISRDSKSLNGMHFGYINRLKHTHKRLQTTAQHGTVKYHALAFANTKSHYYVSK